MHVDGLKDSLRQQMLRERAALSPSDWEAQEAAMTRALLGALPPGVRVVAAYASRPGEPGTTRLVEALREEGLRVLLPLVGRGQGWAWFTSWGETVTGWGGIRQPTGPRLDAAAIREADLVIVPCLAIGRDGTRLGTGGGWYDRVLPLRRRGVPVWALARAREVMDTVPDLPHDVAVDAVVTETGFANLGGSANATYHG